jgi:hypothetical protein
VPPATLALFGRSALTVGPEVARYVKPPTLVAGWLSGLVTTTSTAAGAIPANAGVVAVIWVALLNVTDVAATPSNVTVGVATKPVPAMTTLVPPNSVPELGVRLVMVGPLAVSFIAVAV